MGFREGALTVEFNEAVAIPSAHVASRCPFCPIDKNKEDLTSHIGKDNNSKTLADNLEGQADRKTDHLYYDAEFELYRHYSAEAHHLICGKEVLKEEGEVEKYLVAQNSKTSKGSAGSLEPNDVGYDVNCYQNGIWLPSVPDMFRKAEGEPKRWWGDQTRWNKENPAKPTRVSLDEWERCDAAFIVMDAVKRQFHKGPHGSVGEPHTNYVVMAIGRLRQLTAFLNFFAESCPMEDDGSTRDGPPFWPPYGVIPILHALSTNLHGELVGHPSEWNYFISEFALKCSDWWKRHLAT
jgi:hypothetical protein